MKQYANYSKNSNRLQAMLFLVSIIISCTLVLLGTWSDIFGVYGLVAVIAGFIIFVVLGCVSAQFDISHPFIWFNVVFMLYSLATPILNLQGEYYYYKKYKWINIKKLYYKY